MYTFQIHETKISSMGNCCLPTKAISNEIQRVKLSSILKRERERSTEKEIQENEVICSKGT